MRQFRENRWQPQARPSFDFGAKESDEFEAVLLSLRIRGEKQDRFRLNPIPAMAHSAIGPPARRRYVARFHSFYNNILDQIGSFFLNVADE